MDIKEANKPVREKLASLSFADLYSIYLFCKERFEGENEDGNKDEAEMFENATTCCVLLMEIRVMDLGVAWGTIVNVLNEMDNK